MQINLKNNENMRKNLVIFSIVASLTSIFVVFGYDFIFPVPAALLALMILIERNNKKYCSIAVSGIALVSNALSLLLFGGMTFGGVEIVLFGLLLSFCFSKDISKAETAFLLTLVSVLFIGLNAVWFAMSFMGDFSLDAVSTFYANLYDQIKELFLKSLSDLIASLPEESANVAFSSDQVVALLDSFKSMTVSLVAIVGFVISGITLKIFSFAAFRLSGNKDIVFKWRFKPSSLFAYAYFTLFVLTIFFGDPTTLTGVTITNLSNIFCIVFAYVGFNFALSLLSLKRSVAFSFVLLLIGIVLFTSLMIEILSIIGAFAIIKGSKTVLKK